MKKKVLYHALAPEDATCFYRIAPLRYIEHPDFEFISGNYLTFFSWETLLGIDILIFQRPFSAEHANVLLLAKNMGIKVILDFDDDLLSVDMYNPTYSLYEANREHHRRCVGMADEVWVSTPVLKEVLSKYNSNIHVIPNAHNDYLFPVEKKLPFNMNTKHVLWRGGGSHVADMYEIGNEVTEMVNKNPDWTFNFWGCRFTFMEQRCGDNYICRMDMSLMDYFKALREYNPNIVFFPLNDTPFNHSKSNICFLEAVYAGAAMFADGHVFDEFHKPGISDVTHLFEELIYPDFEVLKEANECSWGYIMENLLLSNVNELRKNRILSNL